MLNTMYAQANSITQKIALRKHADMYKSTNSYDPLRRTVVVAIICMELCVVA